VGQPIAPILKDPVVFLDCLTLDDGTDRPSRNVGNYQSKRHNMPEDQRSHPERQFSHLCQVRNLQCASHSRCKYCSTFYTKNTLIYERQLVQKSFGMADNTDNTRLALVVRRIIFYLKKIVLMLKLQFWQFEKFVPIKQHHNGVSDQQLYVFRAMFSLIWAKTSPETCRADLKLSINGDCCISLVTYLVILTMHGDTNINNIKYIVSFR
jgi:hypothetical protein